MVVVVVGLGLFLSFFFLLNLSCMQTYDFTFVLFILISPLFVLLFFIFSPLVAIHRSSSLVPL